MPKPPKVPQSEFSKSLLKLSQDMDQIIEGIRQLQSDWKRLLQKPLPPGTEPPPPPTEVIK